MGNAVENHEEQIKYLQNRVNMLKNVVDSMDASSADADDLGRLLQALDFLHMKVRRYKKDWDEGR